MGYSMSQQAAVIPTDLPPDADVHTFARLRHALIRVLRVSPESREPVCDALELVEALQQKLDPSLTLGSSLAAAQPRPTRERKTLAYHLHNDPTGGYLIEQREGQSQPFRCPRATYDAAAHILAAASHPLHFDQLLEQTGKRLRERQPDYRLRVAVRFWLSQDLIAKVRTKYTPTDRAHFLQEAQAAWERLSQNNATAGGVSQVSS